MAYDDCLEMIKKAAQEGAVKLDLSGQGLERVPPEIGCLTQLTSLDLSDNQLTALPPKITRLTQLTSLDLSDNQLTVLPPEITRLTQLTSLYLSNNRLTEVPPSISQLTQLTSLNLSFNQLAAVPAAITDLTQLTWLNLSRNQLTEVPAVISQLTQLTTLGLLHNRLTAVPVWITKLTKLRTLGLSGNEVLDLPPEIVKKWQDAPAILRYIEQIAGEEPKRPLNEAKVLLVRNTPTSIRSFPPAVSRSTTAVGSTRRRRASSCLRTSSPRFSVVSSLTACGRHSLRTSCASTGGLRRSIDRLSSRPLSGRSTAPSGWSKYGRPSEELGGRSSI